jgi:hypothetical protein
MSLVTWIKMDVNGHKESFGLDGNIWVLVCGSGFTGIMTFKFMDYMLEMDEL